ncbi:MAG: hypothetical protein ABIG11_01375, partial [bacterium]
VSLPELLSGNFFAAAEFHAIHFQQRQTFTDRLIFHNDLICRKYRQASFASQQPGLLPITR